MDHKLLCATDDSPDREHGFESCETSLRSVCSVVACSLHSASHCPKNGCSMASNRGLVALSLMTLRHLLCTPCLSRSNLGVWEPSRQFHKTTCLLEETRMFSRLTLVLPKILLQRSSLPRARKLFLNLDHLVVDSWKMLFIRNPSNITGGDCFEEMASSCDAHDCTTPGLVPPLDLLCHGSTMGPCCAWPLEASPFSKRGRTNKTLIAGEWWLCGTSMAF